MNMKERINNENKAQKISLCARILCILMLKYGVVKASRMVMYYIDTHNLGKQILHTYFERCLFRLLQASSSTISFSQILHFRPFKGFLPDFLTRTNFQGILGTYVIFSDSLNNLYKFVKTFVECH
jgi:hypothetical protein